MWRALSRSGEFRESRDPPRLKGNWEGCGGSGGSWRVWGRGGECRAFTKISRSRRSTEWSELSLSKWTGQVWVMSIHPCNAHEVPRLTVLPYVPSIPKPHGWMSINKDGGGMPRPHSQLWTDFSELWWLDTRNHSRQFSASAHGRAKFTPAPLVKKQTAFGCKL